ncbi:MAG: WecB/TagA/CpsF family glycosyltransferase [Patescibacteria group bacterium]|nr:WecB/TagA/CpsF family glycosyltransferase [Patescibacteria group bacterium]
MKIFGVSIGKETKDDVFARIENALQGQENELFISTLNNEILLEADKDSQYKEILNNTDLRIVDSIGIKIVSLLKGNSVGQRIAGADLAKHILIKANEKKMSIGAIIRAGGFSNKEDLQIALKKCSNLVIISRDANNTQIKKDVEKLAKSEILFVGLGTPHQEEYIWNIKDHLPKLKIAIGIGGTFDYWTNKKKRAPKFISKTGIEWLWRLIIQPNRACRTWNATVVFLWKALTS